MGVIAPPVTFLSTNVTVESAGINRHGEGDENALHRRSSDPRWPRVMRWRSVRAQRSVDRGRVGGAIEPRKRFSPGCRRLLWWAEGHVAGGAIASRGWTLRGQRTQARTTSSMRENREIQWLPAVVDDAPSWMVRGVADRWSAGREGNAEAVIPR